MSEHPAENDATSFGGGGYYAYDQPTLDRADEHGCLDEDVNTGDPLVCRSCAFPPNVIPPAVSAPTTAASDEEGRDE